MKSKLFLSLIVLALFLTGCAVAFAQTGATGSYSPFKVLNGVISPQNTTWSLKINQLGGSGTQCVQVDNNGLFAVSGTGACGSGGGGSASFAFPFTMSSIGGVTHAATSTTLLLTNGLISTASTTIAAPLRLSTLTQGWGYIGSGGLVGTVSTSTLSQYLFPNTSYGASTSTVLGFLGGLFSTASSTFSSSLFLPSLTQGNLYLGSAGLVQTQTTSTPTVTAPITYSGTLGQFAGGVSGTFGCTSASAGVTGCLTGTDWSTFNNKGSGSVTSITAGAGLLGGAITTSGTIYAQVGTSSIPTINPAHLAYWTTVGDTTNPAKLGSTATTTLTGTAPIAFSQPISVIGGAASVITCTTATASLPGCISAASFSKHDSATTTFSTGLTYTGATNAVTVNTSQNIATLSNLTNNGFVITSGGTGALSIQQFPATIAQGGTNNSGLTSANSIVTVNSAGTALIATGTQLTVGNLIATTTAASSFGGLVSMPYSSSTIYSSFLTSSSTFANIGTLTFGGVTASTWSAFCTSITGSSALCDGDDATGGAGSGSSKWATTTAPNTMGIYPAGAGYVGIGTTTPAWQLQVASSTAPQLTLSDGVNPHWSFRNAGGDLFIGTSSPTNYATNTPSALRLANTTRYGLAIATDTPFATLAVNPFAGQFSNQFVIGSSTATALRVDNGGQLFLGTSGVRITQDEDGAITFKSNGNGNLEDFTINLDDTSNSAVLTSSTGLNVFDWGSIGADYDSSTVTLSTVAGAIDASSATSLRIPNNAAPTLSQNGQIAVDTTSNNIIYATTTTASTPVVLQSATTTLYAYTATTSPIVSGTTMNLPAHFLRQVVTGVICKVSSGTSLVVNISTAAGTSDTNAITCTTTENQYAITSNYIFAAYAGLRMEYGTKTGDTGDLSIRIIGYRISD